jgi:hypothetical protein
MKTRTHFAHSIDMLDAAGEIQEHLAGVEDFEVAEATFWAAMKRWPKAAIILRANARVIHDSRKAPFDVPGEEIDRHSSLGYYNYAASYHAAAELIVAEGLEATHPSSPAMAMYCHAIELYLKSFLRLHRISAVRLRWIGHDFQKLQSRARTCGLILSDEDCGLIDWMESLWSRARYLETGFYQAPRIQSVAGTCRNLKQSVCEALRAAGQPILSPSRRRAM